MEISINKERLEGLVASIARDLVNYSWTIFSSTEDLHLLVFGIDKKGDLRHFQTIIDK